MPLAAPRYKDFWFKIIGSLAGSQIIDALNREESFFERFTTKYFYTDLIGGFAIAFILWEVVRLATNYLDQRYDWLKHSLTRLVLQLLLGVFVPALLSFFLTWAFMRFAYKQDIFQTSWLYNEFYTVVLIIVLVNLVYFAWWLYLEGKENNLSTIKNEETVSTESISGENNIATKSSSLVVTKGNKSVLLPHTEIAYAYLSDNNSYIKTMEEETFITNFTLDQLGRSLNDHSFFRVNRQLIVNRVSVKAYQSVENGKIELELSPSFKSPVIVSQKRAREFRKWINQAVNS